MTVALCMFALWAWGGWISWKGIENGNGWIGVILSEKIRKSLNKKENWWKKALLSVAFGYVGCKGDRVDSYFCHAHGGRLAF